MAAVGFTPQDAGRIASVVRSAEHTSRGGAVPPRARGGYPWNPGIVIALTTSTITARSGSQLGSGTATLYTVSDTGVKSAGDSVTLWNNASGTDGAISTGKEVQASFGYGKWLVHWEQCAT